jgi:hypothetical protein
VSSLETCSLSIVTLTTGPVDRKLTVLFTPFGIEGAADRAGRQWRIYFDIIDRISARRYIRLSVSSIFLMADSKIFLGCH